MFAHHMLLHTSFIYLFILILKVYFFFSLYFDSKAPLFMS